MNSQHIRYGICLFLFCVGAYLFCRGFFLHRNVIRQVSQCADSSTFYNIPKDDSLTESELCWSKPRFKRAVILVIDALKYDFTILSDDMNAHYANKMPVFDELRYKYPEHAFHSKFVADSPTTTLQRLTALLTGSMPTFIDAATNFYQSSIVEDNIIKQMSLNDKKIVFMGDDTWMNLIPEKFHKSYPYPSFVVKDLHTVDDGIISHIYDELNEDFDVLIAHFLGVDHCGHWYHQNHPEMASKLRQMNDIVKNVSQHLKDDDVLVVLGDHGMTLSGDHGGDTDDETNAALFMFTPPSSKNKLLRRLAAEESKVSQIDLVPTLSLLLGLPIPFSSLGFLIEPIFLSDPIQGSELLSLWMNVQQVQRYVNTSSHLFKQIPHKVNHLNRLWDVLRVNFDDPHSITSFHRAATNYLQQIQAMARSAFTVFNIPFMSLGLLHLCMASILALFCCKSTGSSADGEAYEGSFYKYCMVIIAALYSLGHMSNSFVINEDSATLYLLQLVLLLTAVANRAKWRIASAIVGIMALVRILSPYGWICRYEQGCEVSPEDLDQISPWKMYLAAVCVIALTAFAILNLRQSFGQSYSRSASAQIISVLLYTGCLSLLGYWAVLIQDADKIQRLGNHHELLPNLSFICMIAFQVSLCLHRKYSNDRVITRIDYASLHAVGMAILTSVYTHYTHVPSVILLSAVLIFIHTMRCVPEELEGVLAYLLMQNAFYATGHQNTFQQIQWKVAFTGTAIGSSNVSSGLILAGMRVLINTFCGQIIVCYLLPSMILRGMSRNTFLALTLLKVTAQCFACFILRQHLMLWAVFATRLLFEMTAISICLISVMCGALFCKNSAVWRLSHMGLIPNGDAAASKRKNFKQR